MIGGEWNLGTFWECGKLQSKWIWFVLLGLGAGWFGMGTPVWYKSSAMSGICRENRCLSNPEAIAAPRCWPRHRSGEVCLAAGSRGWRRLMGGALDCPSTDAGLEGQAEPGAGAGFPDLLSEREREDPVFFAESRLGFRPDETQAQLLDRTVMRGILVATRGWGKSTVMSLKALHHGMSRSEDKVLLMSPTWGQAREFMNKIRRFMARLGLRVVSARVGKESLMLPNGTVIAAVSARSEFRGFNGASLVLIDEAASVSDEAYLDLSPMKDPTAAVWVLGTPRGRKGFFWETWAHGGEEWRKVSVRASECARFPAAYLEEERRKLGDRKFLQEFQCEFLDTKDSLLTEEQIEAVALDSVQGLWLS